MPLQCSQKVYDLLMRARLPERIAPVAADIESALREKNIYIEGPIRAIVTAATANQDTRWNLGPAARQDIVALDCQLEDYSSFRDFCTLKLPNHPYLLGAVILGEDLKNFSTWGFLSERDLALGVTAFCIGEQYLYAQRNDLHEWRAGARKSVVHLATHGDVSISQYEVDFPEICLDVYGTGFGVKQDPSQILSTVLLYIRYLNEEHVAEIRDWPKYVVEYDQHNCWGPGYERWQAQSEKCSNQLRFQLDNYRLIGTTLGECGPMRIELDHGTVWPMVEGEELHFYVTGASSEQVIYPWGGDRGVKVSKVATFTRNDIPDLLKGLYKTYARDRAEMCELLWYFTS